MRLSILPALLLCLAGGLAAQSPSLSTIYAAPAANNEGIRPGLIAERGTAVTADGRIWATSYWWQTGTPTLRECRIHVSADGGASWTQAATVRMAQATYASMVTSTDGTTLHIAFQGRTNTSATYEWGIYYAAYDTVSGTWLGPDVPILPATGTGKYDQVTSPNIAMNSRGVLLVSGIKSTGWSTWFSVNDGTGWGSAIKLQGGSYSKNSCVLEGPDDCFHFCYQSSGTYSAYYRRWDPATGAFGAEGEILVKAGISNETTMALSPAGDIWIGYITSPGSSGANPGWIEVSHGTIGTWQFTPHQIYVDPLASGYTLTWGNHSYYIAQLARSGDRTRIYYTKPTGTVSGKDIFRPGPLWCREWTGAGFGPEYAAITTPPGSQILFPLGRSSCPPGLGEFLTFSVYLYDNATPPNVIAQLLQCSNDPGFTVGYGMGCETSAKSLPRVGSSHYPYPGNSTYRVTMTGAMPTTSAIMMLGTSNSSMGGVPLPFDLTLLGWSGCQLFNNVTLSYPATTDGNGQASAGLPIPNDPNLVGAIAYTQWGFIDALAPGGLRFTGGNALVIR